MARADRWGVFSDYRCLKEVLNLILSAHQPQYLGYLGFYHKIMLSDVFVILDDVQYERGSYVARNKIKTQQGELMLTIPLRMENHLNKTIRQMEIADDRWRKKHWQSIYNAYHRAPYWEEYKDIFDEFYNKYFNIGLINFLGMNKFSEAIYYLTLGLINLLKIDTKIVQQSHLDIERIGHKQELILNLCKHFGADTFIFGSQGHNYADVELFKQHGIRCVFQDYQHPVYPQQWGEFMPYMSVIDLLFNCGADKARELITQSNLSREELLNGYR
jgi:hypothetical protein